MELCRIGRVRSAHTSQQGTPIQPVFGEHADRAQLEIDAPFREALADLSGFGRIWVLTWLDRAPPFRPRVVPHRDTVERGLFATRAPCRPSPLGLSCVELLAVDAESGLLELGATDLLDGTPVLDIKPYLPGVDAFPDARAGWFGASLEEGRRADDRFNQ